MPVKPKKLTLASSADAQLKFIDAFAAGCSLAVCAAYARVNYNTAYSFYHNERNGFKQRCQQAQSDNVVIAAKNKVKQAQLAKARDHKAIDSYLRQADPEGFKPDKQVVEHQFKFVESGRKFIEKVQKRKRIDAKVETVG